MDELDKTHGSHTLRVWSGVIVGTNRDDVFVELGPRMQGVISARQFEDAPSIGSTYQFTLRGKEEGLWALSLSDARSLATWEDMEQGSLVHARVMRSTEGGLQLKIGPLHAFMPKSQTGLPRGERQDVLVGKTLPCEVIEVDAERQRVMVSRKVVLQRERENAHQREVGKLQVGKVVQGRVTRIEEFGAFVTFGRGMEGLIHVSNLSDERVDHPTDVVKLGDHVDAKVLTVKRGGRRIALGLKQMHESPWKMLKRKHYPGELIEGRITRLEDYGAFVELMRGVEGLVHQSETPHEPGRLLREHLAIGQKLTVRIQQFDCEAERLSLSALHANGTPIADGEAQKAKDFADLKIEGSGGVGTNLGDMLKRALDERRPAG